MPVIEKRETWPDFTELDVMLAQARFLQQPDPVPKRDDRTTPATIPSERLRLASADIRYLSSIIRQLNELREEPESDEYGVLRASDVAFDAACNLLTDAAISLALHGCQVPYGCASTDSEGGVRVEWVRDASSVHLVVPPIEGREGYIYREAGNAYSTDPLDSEVLARRLQSIN